MKPFATYQQACDYANRLQQNDPSVVAIVNGPIRVHSPLETKEKYFVVSKKTLSSRIWNPMSTQYRQGI